MSGAQPILVEELIAGAGAATGLTDFGEPPIQPALGKIVDALNGEARLSEIGRAGRVQSLVGLLVNRLLLARYLQTNADVLDDELGTPIVVVGLPRSGTTKLQRMIAADDSLNSIKFWECLCPLPLSDSPDDTATRIGIAHAYADALRQSPEFFAAHPVMPEEPEEEMVLMRHSLLNESLDAEVRVPSFIRWLHDQDRAPMYRQLAVWMRILARQHGKVGVPWILKGTYHGAHLDILLEHLPNARIVYCHRDPVETIASYSSLVTKMRALSSDDVDPRDVGQELLAFWSDHLNRTLAAFEQVPHERILHVPYRDIIGDGAGVIERIYEFAGVALGDDGRAAITGWDRDNAQHKHGRHDYRATDYGLSDELIAQATERYRKEYGHHVAPGGARRRTNRFDGKVAVVLGATSEGGMGEAVAKDLAREGATVVVSGRRREQAELLAKSINGAAYPCDVGEEEQVRSLMSYAATEIGDGRVDIVVNASAAVIGAGFLRDLDAATLAESARINLVGQVMAMKHAAAHLRRGGVYLQFSSYSAQQPAATTGSYAICKAGVEHALRIAAVEYPSEGIRFVGLAPGIIFTPLTAFINNEAVENTVRSVTPLDRMVTLEDVAATVRYLVSDECFETGAVYPLSGGALLTRALLPEEFVMNQIPGQ